MKHKLDLHYTITNCGDGSASITFVESAELANFDQDGDNGWGEPCLGFISIESDAPITVNEEIDTKESYLVRLIDNEDSRLGEFIEEFFPNGVPEFSVVLDDKYKDKTYANNLIYLDGKHVGEILMPKVESGEALLKRLNELTNGQA